jgi:hypothetical protein
MANAISDRTESDLTVSFSTFSAPLPFSGAPLPEPVQLVDNKHNTSANPKNNTFFTTLKILLAKFLLIKIGCKVTAKERNHKTL